VTRRFQSSPIVRSSQSRNDTKVTLHANIEQLNKQMIVQTSRDHTRKRSTHHLSDYEPIHPKRPHFI
jgi:hypothetical protein